LEGGKMKITKQQMIELYTNMVRVRNLDKALVNGIKNGKVLSFFHSQEGQEAPGVATCALLKKGDYLFHTHRGHGIGKTLPRGVPARAILAEHYGKATGICGGFSGWHTCDMELGIVGHSGTVGGQLTLAAGMGIVAKIRGKGNVVTCFLGDGTTGRGAFHEAMLMAANWKLPVVWICENNLYAVQMPVSEAYPKENIADLAFGYGIPGVVVDGQDVTAVYEVVQVAINRARAGEGPSLIECKTYRTRSQAEGIPDFDITLTPRSEEEIATWKKRDPIKLFKERLLKQGIITEADIDRIDHEVAKEMEEAERFATESPIPDPEILEKAIYAE
jgi:pyruvate dehydrogenase E1 component alpha subunit